MREPGAARIVVESRRSRKHYGTVAYEPFDERKHDSSRKYDHLSLPLSCTYIDGGKQGTKLVHDQRLCSGYAVVDSQSRLIMMNEWTLRRENSLLTSIRILISRIRSQSLPLKSSVGTNESWTVDQQWSR